MTTLPSGQLVQGGSAAPKRAKRRRTRISGWHFVLAPIALLFMTPFVQMLLASLSPAEELVRFPPPFVPSRLTLDGFAGLFSDTDIVRWLVNSTIVSLIAICAHVVLCPSS